MKVRARPVTSGWQFCSQLIVYCDSRYCDGLETESFYDILPWHKSFAFPCQFHISDNWHHVRYEMMKEMHGSLWWHPEIYNQYMGGDIASPCPFDIQPLTPGVWLLNGICSKYRIHSNRHSCPNRRSPSFIIKLFAHKIGEIDDFLYKNARIWGQILSPSLCTNYMFCSHQVHYY